MSKNSQHAKHSLQPECAIGHQWGKLLSITIEGGHKFPYKDLEDVNET